MTGVLSFVVTISFSASVLIFPLVHASRLQRFQNDRWGKNGAMNILRLRPIQSLALKTKKKQCKLKHRDG